MSLGRPALAENEGQGVTVHLDALPPLELFRHDPEGKLERRVCTAPCDEVVLAPPGAQFFVDSGSIPRSPLFELARPGPVRVEVKQGNTGTRITGVLSIALGSAASAAGTVALLVRLFNPTMVPDGRGSFEPDDAPLTIGIACITTGAVIGGLGIFFMATSGTRVSVEQRQAAAAPLSFSF